MMPQALFRFDAGQQQLILLALAQLSLTRPGFDYALGEVADVFRGRELYETFKSYGPDPDPSSPLGSMFRPADERKPPDA